MSFRAEELSLDLQPGQEHEHRGMNWWLPDWKKERAPGSLCSLEFLPHVSRRTIGSVFRTYLRGIWGWEE